MQKLFLSVFLVCITWLVSNPFAHAATSVQDPGSSNNLYQIVNEMMGTSFTSSQDPALTELEVTADDYWHEWDGYISIVATFAGYDQNIYWEDGTTSVFIHAASLDGVHDYGNDPITFQTNGLDFWFKNMTSGGAWFSREELNSDSLKHMVTYAFGEGVFICAFEDLSGLGDQDYNDLVFKLTYGAAPVNVPAIAEIPDQATSAGYPFSDVDLNGYIRDDDSNVTWTTSGGSNISVTVNQTTATASVSYTSGWTGSEDITFMATDELGFYDTEVVTFTVTPPDAPVLLDIPDQVVNPGESFEPIHLDDYVYHPDPLITDEDITWSVSGQSKLTVLINSDRVAGITYPRGAVGSETITFTATINPSTSDAATFTVLASGPPHVGGIAEPIPKVRLLYPWFGALFLLCAGGVGIHVWRKKSQTHTREES